MPRRQPSADPHLRVVGRQSNGQPRTYRLAPPPAQPAAYRRLTVAILGLDVATLAKQLHSARSARSTTLAA